MRTDQLTARIVGRLHAAGLMPGHVRGCPHRLPATQASDTFVSWLASADGISRRGLSCPGGDLHIKSSADFMQTVMAGAVLQPGPA